MINRFSAHVQKRRRTEKKDQAAFLRRSRLENDQLLLLGGAVFIFKDLYLNFNFSMTKCFFFLVLILQVVLGCKSVREGGGGRGEKHGVRGN